MTFKLFDSNKDIVRVVRRFAQALLDDNGYEADLDEYTEFRVRIGGNGCVTYTIELDGLYDYEPVKLDIEIKYDAEPDNDHGHFEPDVIWLQLRADGLVIIDETNNAYGGNRT